jgi:hypothetical protein
MASRKKAPSDFDCPEDGGAELAAESRSAGAVMIGGGVNSRASAGIAIIGGADGGGDGAWNGITGGAAGRDSKGIAGGGDAGRASNGSAGGSGTGVGAANGIAGAGGDELRVSNGIAGGSGEAGAVRGAGAAAGAKGSAQGEEVLMLSGAAASRSDPLCGASWVRDEAGPKPAGANGRPELPA